MVFALRPGVTSPLVSAHQQLEFEGPPGGGRVDGGPGGSGQARLVLRSFLFGLRHLARDTNRDALRGETRQGTPTETLLIFSKSDVTLGCLEDCRSGE